MSILLRLDPGLLRAVIEVLRTCERRQAYIRSSGISGAQGYYDAYDAYVASSNASNCLSTFQHLPPSIVVFYNNLITNNECIMVADAPVDAKKDGYRPSPPPPPLYVFPGIPNTNHSDDVNLPPGAFQVDNNKGDGNSSGSTNNNTTSSMLIDLGLIQYVTTSYSNSSDCDAMNTSLAMADFLGAAMVWFGSAPFLNLAQKVVSTLNFVNGGFIDGMDDEHPFTGLSFKSINFYKSLEAFSSMSELQHHHHQQHHQEPLTTTSKITTTLGGSNNITVVGGGVDTLGWNLGMLARQCFAECTQLESCNLEALTNVDSIEFNLFHNCSSLRSLDLSPFQFVTEIAGGFLKGCSGLTEIDVSPLSHLTGIDDGFLEGCSGLERIHGMDSWHCLGSFIGHRFLMGCSGLRWTHPSTSTSTLSTPPLLHQQPPPFSLKFIETNNISVISTDFLAGCTGLEYVSLESLKTVERIDCGFLSNCTSLRHIDASAINGGGIVVYDIGFLNGCAKMVSAELPGGGVDGGPMGRLLTAHISKHS